LFAEAGLSAADIDWCAVEVTWGWRPASPSCRCHSILPVYLQFLFASCYSVKFVYILLCCLPFRTFLHRCCHLSFLIFCDGYDVRYSVKWL